MEGLKGIIKKPWFWLVIGGVALIAVVMRKKGTSSAVAAEDPNNQAYRIAGQGMAQSAADQGSALDQFLVGMQLKDAQQQSSLSDFQYQQQAAQNSLYDKLFKGLSAPKGSPERQGIAGLGIKCPQGQGNPYINPQTLQVECRSSGKGGFFSGVNANGLIDLGTAIFGGRTGTTRIPSRRSGGPNAGRFPV